MTDARSSAGPHVEPDVLADLHEGLLDDSAAAPVRAHLAGCLACRGELAALDDVRHQLAGAGPIGAVPDDLVQRLDQALAAAASEPGSTAASRTVIPLRKPQRSVPRGMRLLQVAAVLVLVFAGGALGVSALGGPGGSSSNESGTAGGSASEGAADAGGEATFPVTASGRNWTGATLRDSAAALAGGSLTPPAAGRLSQPEASSSAKADDGRTLADAPASQLAGGPALASCAAQLAGQPVTPVAVDLARYEGQPAAVILLPTADEPTAVDLYVVAPDCPPGAFLYFARVPRS